LLEMQEFLKRGEKANAERNSRSQCGQDPGRLIRRIAKVHSSM
jgi:hypothetical protein